MKTLLEWPISGTKRLRAALSRRRFGYVVVLVLVIIVAGLAPAGAITVPDTVRGVRFGDHISYERAVVDLGSRREATDLAPTYRLSYRGGDWVMRLDLPTTKHTLTTGGSGLGRAISRYHVVRIEAGSLSVYFHLTGAADSVDVFRLNHPARVVVDISPDDTVEYVKPTIGANTVVLRPRAGRLVGPGAFTVKGYGRPFEGQGAWRIRDASGRLVEQGNYTTSDWATTWGTFGFTASYPRRLAGLEGELEVGQYSSRDGGFEGVTLPLRFR